MKSLNQTFIKTLLTAARVSDTQHDTLLEAIQLVIDEEIAQYRYDSFMKDEAKRFIPTLISLHK